MNQSAMRNPTHDTESLFFLVKRLAPILAEMSFVSVIRTRKIATTFGPSWTLVLGADRMPAIGTFRTSHLHRRMSAIGGKADMTRTGPLCRLMTRSGRSVLCLVWREIYRTRSEFRILSNNVLFPFRKVVRVNERYFICGALLGALLQWQNRPAAFGSRGSDVQSRLLRRTIMPA